MKESEVNMFNKLLLVQLVKARPALWHVGTDDYCNKPLKRECWLEVCREMKDNFDDLSQTEQEKYREYFNLFYPNLTLFKS